MMRVIEWLAGWGFVIILLLVAFAFWLALDGSGFWCWKVCP